MPQSDSLDFDAVAQCLQALGAPWEPAEAHGAFCGMACLSGAAALSDWARELAPDIAPSDLQATERQARLQQLAADALLKLEAGQMAFELLLPDADSSLSARTAALADWCHGFMHGLMAVGHPDTGPHWESLDSDVAREIVDDFNAITRAAVDPEAGDESEAALAELVEYVRVSAQLMYEDAYVLRQRLAGTERPADKQGVS